MRDILHKRAGALVGRDRELSELLRLIDGDSPRVAMVYGIAGVGKSTLVRAAAARARGRGAAVVQLEGAAIEPTERGFLRALAGVLGGALETTQEATHRLAAQGPLVLLVVDSSSACACSTAGFGSPWFRRCRTTYGFSWQDGIR